MCKISHCRLFRDELLFSQSCFCGSYIGEPIGNWLIGFRLIYQNPMNCQIKNQVA